MNHLHMLAADMRRKYLEARRDASLGLTEHILTSWLNTVEPIADEVDQLRARVAELERDAERFEWFFGPQEKMAFIAAYLEGVAANWSVAQWRVAIDAARLPDMKKG